MSETDLPDTGTGNGEALSFQDGVAAIENLLTDDLEAELTGEGKSQTGQEQPDEGDDDLVLSDDEDAEADASEEVQEYKAGKFASDDAKVTLDDGTTISVAELKRNNLFQRDYTRKTQEIAQARQEFENTQRQFAEYAQQLAQQRELIETLAAEYVPVEPSSDMLNSDPIGYMHAKAQYDQQMARLNQLFQSKAHQQQHMTAQQQQEHQQRLVAEQNALLQAMPQLKTKEKFEQFRNDALSIGTEVYGLRAEEISSVADHRFIRVLADAIAYRKAIAKRDAGKQPLAPQPNKQQPRIQQRQRMAPQSEASQRIKQAEAAFAKSRSIDAAAKLLENFV